MQEKKGVFDGLKQIVGLKPSVEDSPVYSRLIAAKKYGEVLSMIMQDSTDGRRKFVNIRYVLMLMKKEGKKFIFDQEHDDEKEIREATFKLKSTMQQGERVSRWDFNDVRQLFIKYFKYHPGFSSKFINTLNTFLNIGINYKYFV